MDVGSAQIQNALMEHLSVGTADDDSAQFSRAVPSCAFSGEVHKVFSQQLRQIAYSLEHFPGLAEETNKVLELAGDAEHALMVVIVGEFKAGKSTFINALLSEEVVTVDVTPATATVTMLSYGEKKEIKAHFKDGTTDVYPYKKLSSLSAEGDEEAKAIREKLKYIEVILPNELLKKITIVDTPGLNSTYHEHTKMTESFIQRADQVFWLFSFMNAGTSTELDQLSRFNRHQKPIGIVNHIDAYDEEEDDLELDEFLDYVQRRMGDAVTQVIGVSAKEALQAKTLRDQKLFKDSRWSNVEKLINKDLVEQAGKQKINQLIEKTLDVVGELAAAVDSAYADYLQMGEKVEESERRLSELWEFGQILNHQYQNWHLYTPEDALFAMKEQLDVPGVVDNNHELNQYKKRLNESFQELMGANIELQDKQKTLEEKISSHNDDVEKLENMMSRWLAGTASYTEGRLSESERIKDRQANELNQKIDQLNQINQSLRRNLKNYHAEAHEVIRNVISAYEDKLNKLPEETQNEIDKKSDYEANQREVFIWGKQAADIINHTVALRLAALVNKVVRQTTADVDKIFAFDEVKTFSDVYKAMEELRNVSFELDIESFGEKPSFQGDLTQLVKNTEKDNAYLELETGVYEVSEPIVLNKNITIIGSAMGKTEIKTDFYEGIPVVKSEGCELKLEHLHFTHQSQAPLNIIEVHNGEIFIDSCSFTGAYDPKIMEALYTEEEIEEEGKGVAIVLSGHAHGQISKSSFYKNSIAIALVDEAQGIITNSQIYSNKVIGVTANDDSSVHLVGCDLTDQMIGFTAGGNSYGDIEKNAFYNNNRGMVLMDDTTVKINENEMVANTETGIISLSQKSLISNNYVKSNSYFGIRILEGSDGLVRMNTVEHHPVGIDIVDSSNQRIEYNCLRFNGAAVSIRLNTSNVHVEQNDINENYYDGVLLDENGLANITDNVFVNNDFSSIRIVAQAKAEVTGNHIINGNEGISIAEQAEAKVVNNTIEKQEITGIFVSGTGFADVSNNICRSIKYNGILIYDHVGGIFSYNSCYDNDFGFVVLGDSSCEIKSNNIHNNIIGIRVHDQSTVEMRENKLENHEEYGIQINGYAEAKVFHGKHINNRLCGILASEQAKVGITQNYFSYNFVGLSLEDEVSGDVGYNSFENNNQALYITNYENVRFISNH